MTGAMEFLLKHGGAIVFAAVLAEQIGLPLPSAPVLLAAGALAGFEGMNLWVSLGLAVVASLLGDSLWFYLGKRRGSAILGFLCKISLEPDSCVSKTRSMYSRYGAGSLLVSKFVPGLSTVAPPMAGMFGLAPWKFLMLDAGGSLLWAGTYTAIGWMFRTQLERLAVYLERFGSSLGMAVAAVLALYVAIKYIQRRRIYGALRVARITPWELKERLDAGETLTIVDLRSEVERREGSIQGSLHLAEGEVESAFASTVRTENARAEIILYCSCPNEITSARAALRLKRQGASHVRPLEGGFPLWRELGFPVEGVAQGSPVEG